MTIVKSEYHLKKLKSLCSYVAFHMNETNNILPTPGYFAGRLSDIKTDIVLVVAVDAIINYISEAWGTDSDVWPIHVHILLLAAVVAQDHLQNWKDLNDNFVQLLIAACRNFAANESVTPEYGIDFMDHLPWH